jgi:two-component system cell cycle sensor histidine kinase/response regulator CckA
MELGTKRRETILVVDDNYSITALIKAFLEIEGYTVLIASDAEAAIQLYHENRPSVALLLTDVVMPNMNGLELADHILRLEPRMPVLLMSGTECPSRGFGCIAKPFTPADVIGRVGKVLEMRQPAGVAAA